MLGEGKGCRGSCFGMISYWIEMGDGMDGIGSGEDFGGEG